MQREFVTGLKFGIEYFLNNKFGRLQPFEYIGLNNNKRRTFYCICDCGNKVTVTDSNLRNSTKSCGCLKAELIKQRMGKSLEHKRENAKKWEQKNKRWLDPSKKDDRTERTRKYRKKNKNTINEREKTRRRVDVQHRLRKNLRCRMYPLLMGQRKAGSAVDDLGCSVDFLKTHLESLWEIGMNWNNYGNGPKDWSLDHKIPLSYFDLTNREQLLKACHYTNLQPMWHLKNISKGNKYES